MFNLTKGNKIIMFLSIKVEKTYTFDNSVIESVYGEIDSLRNVSVLIGKAYLEGNLAKSFAFKMHLPSNRDILSNLFNRSTCLTKGM